MKIKIVITGQIHGNHRLHSAIVSSGRETTVERPFFDFHIYFKSRKDAEMALWDAYKKLRSLELDFYREGGIRYFSKRQLHYDASKAVIVPVASPDK